MPGLKSTAQRFLSCAAEYAARSAPGDQREVEEMMREHLLDIRLFQYALASLEHGSFRRAAIALSVQQSTVSRGVRSLEHRVGAELFERDHAGIRPTPAGDRFLEEAALGFDHLRRALQRAEALQRGEQGKLTVGVSAPFVPSGILFERFRHAHRGVSVEIVELTTSASWALGFGVTIVVGPLPPACDSVAVVPLTGRNVVSLYAVWMESNPNPALKGLLDIVRAAGQGESGNVAAQAG